MTEQREITLKKEIRGLKQRLTDLEKQRATANHEMLVNAATWDALQMGAFMRKATVLKKKIDSIGQDIHAKEIELSKGDVL